MEMENVCEVLNGYFATEFTDKKDLEDSKVNVENTNIIGQIEKEVLLRLLKTITVDVPKA